MIYEFQFPFEVSRQEIIFTAKVEFYPYEPATRHEPATASYYEVIAITTKSGFAWHKSLYPKIWEHALDIASDFLPEKEEPEQERFEETTRLNRNKSFREFAILFNHAFKR